MHQVIQACSHSIRSLIKSHNCDEKLYRILDFFQLIYYTSVQIIYIARMSYFIIIVKQLGNFVETKNSMLQTVRRFLIFFWTDCNEILRIDFCFSLRPTNYAHSVKMWTQLSRDNSITEIEIETVIETQTERE